MWLAEHSVSGYVIIDDHVDMGELRTHLVLTSRLADSSPPTWREPSRYSCDPSMEDRHADRHRRRLLGGKRPALA